MKNVILVHGYNGIPIIFDYFKKELDKKGYNVVIPDLPTREDITVENCYKIFENNKEYFNEETIVIAHSIGNAVFIKYLSQSKIIINKYISLAGFARDFYIEDKEVLTEKVKMYRLTDEELIIAKNLINKRYSLFSKDDHLVPYEILKEFSTKLDSKPFSIDGVGHMGRKSGITELPIVIDIINNKFD